MLPHISLIGSVIHAAMEKNQLQALVDKVEQTPELKQKLESGKINLLEVANETDYEITKKDATGFFLEMKRITKEDQTNMPPLVVLIMAYLNMLFPELEQTSNL